MPTSTSTSSTATNDDRHQIIPKSPVPKQRKSLAAKSKVERLKSRLSYSKQQAQQPEPPPSKEQLNKMILKSNSNSSSLLSSASSSGVSSSRSSQLNVAPAERATDEQQDSRAEQARPSTSGQYRLCQCLECQTSGQQIYSRAQQSQQALPDNHSYQVPREGRLKRSQSSGGCNSTTSSAQMTSTPGRKAVSFRPSVEHIGSPSYRLLNDAFDLVQPTTTTTTSHDLLDSTCDSMHATKDFSLIGPTTSNNNYDDDYLQPLDCSTPNKSFGAAAAARQQPLEVRAEVHRPVVPLTLNNYTCLCSPDFMCIHNYPTSENSGDQSNRLGVATVSNEIYADSTRQSSADFPLSGNCIECKNLSTYVNLSSTAGRQMTTTTTTATTTANAINEQPAGTNLSSCGYDSGEYKQLIRANKQCEVYGNLAGSATVVSHPATKSAERVNEMLDESLHYLSAARRLQQTLQECALCNEHLIKNGTLLECNCPLGATAATQANPGEQNNQHSDASSSSNSKSYHTASSSLPPTLNESNGLVIMNSTEEPDSSKLSVLPLPGDLRRQQQQHRQQQHQQQQAATSSLAERLHLIDNNSDYHRLQQQQQHLTTVSNDLYCSQLNSNPNLDSSLSSLFVYRHASDTDQPGPGQVTTSTTTAATTTTSANVADAYRGQFDPDSLEILDCSRTTGPGSSGTGKAKGEQRDTNWLKARPKSDYISLSSTTSSVSTANKAKSAGKKFVQVDSDLTQSSLAKRRQLSLQQQTSSGSVKRKLLGPKNSDLSASSASLKAPNKQDNQNKQHQRSTSSSNVKSIYQCVKNHLLDITSSNSSKSVQTGPAKSRSSASLPRHLSSSAFSSPSVVAKSNSRRAPASKTSQVCMLPLLVYDPFWLITQTLTSTHPKLTVKFLSHPSEQMEELRNELARREQEMLTMGAKMKALEDQQRDSQRHIRVLKDSLVAKEEQYNLLLPDVEELRRNLAERNKLIDRRTYQQQQQQWSGGKQQPQVGLQELQDMQSLLEMRDKRINELQRKVVQLDNLLTERDEQLNRARVRLESGHHGSSSAGGGGGHPDVALLSHLEDTLGDKEKQIALLRDQRDRIEHELNEERDSHERSIKEYRMKLNSANFEREKMQVSSSLDCLNVIRLSWSKVPHTRPRLEFTWFHSVHPFKLEKHTHT